MTINEHSSVLHAFTEPDSSEMSGVVDVLTVLRLFPPGKFRYTAGEIVKCEVKNSAYIYVYRYHHFDFLYQCNLRLRYCSQFLFNVNKKGFSKFSKAAGSVTGWRCGYLCWDLWI